MTLENKNLFMEKYLDILLSFNTFVFLLNLILFIFGKKILIYLDTSDLEGKDLSKEQMVSINKQRKFLFVVNLAIFLGYFFTLFFKLELINTFIKVLAILVFSFLLNGFLVRWIVSIYGEKIDVNGETYIKKGYKTRIFSILTTVFVIIVTFYVIVSTLGFEDWLQNGGFIGGLLAFLGFTASVWANDMFSSILILHSNKVDLGDVIEIELNGVKTYAFIKHINLSEVTLIDLVYNNLIILRTSEFRNLKIVNWSRNINGDKAKRITQIIEAKIGYEYSLEQIQELFKYAIYTMLEEIKDTKREKYFPKNMKIKVAIKDFGDFAVVYQLQYEITSPFYIIKALKLLNIYLQKAQKKYGIDFSTPELFVETRVE